VLEAEKAACLSLKLCTSINLTHPPFPREEVLCQPNPSFTYFLAPANTNGSYHSGAVAAPLLRDTPVTWAVRPVPLPQPVPATPQATSRGKKGTFKNLVGLLGAKQIFVSE
jgi:hypothetical protein